MQAIASTSLSGDRFLHPDTPPSPPPGCDTHMDDETYDSDDDILSVSNHRGASSVASFSDDASMRSISPAPSLYSVTSSILEQGFVWEYGREMNSYSEVYRLPADVEELERLDRQHQMLNVARGGKYVSALADVLFDHGRGDVKSVLDLGCGSGAWIMQVARDFPHAQCVAVDLVPMQSENLPANCRAEVDDINLGLEHFYDEFNVVRCALITTGIRDYPGLIDELSRVLRPGGVAEMMEYDFHIFTEDKVPITVIDTPLSSSSQSSAPPVPSPYGPPTTGALPPSSITHAQPRTEAPVVSTLSPVGPYLPKWLYHLAASCRERGSSPDVAPLLPHWMAQHRGFEGVEHRDIWLPVGSWHRSNSSTSTPETEKLTALGEMVTTNMRTFLASARPLLLGTGLDEAYVDELHAACLREMDGAGDGADGERMYMRVEHVVASRKEPGPPPIPQSVLDRLSI